MRGDRPAAGGFPPARVHAAAPAAGGPGPAPGAAAEHAPRLVVGAGCSRGCPPEELLALIEAALAGVAGAPVALATIDRRADDPCVRATAARLGLTLRAHAAAALAGVAVPTPSGVVARHVGTPSVAGAGRQQRGRLGAELLVPKRRSAHATCAVAREAAWPA